MEVGISDIGNWNHLGELLDVKFLYTLKESTSPSTPSSLLSGFYDIREVPGRLSGEIRVVFHFCEGRIVGSFFYLGYKSGKLYRPFVVVVWPRIIGDHPLASDTGSVENSKAIVRGANNFPS